MFYDKKVKYFDYRKNGVRIHGAGFLKMDVRNGMCSMVLQISGLHATDNFSKSVYLVGTDREEELCTLQVREGNGGLQLRIPVDNMAKGLPYENVLGVRIPIAAGCELYCDLGGGSRLGNVSATGGYSPVTGDTGCMEKKIESTIGKTVAEDVEEAVVSAELTISEEKDITAEPEKEEAEVQPGKEVKGTEEAEAQSRKEVKGVRGQKIAEDKWEQLWTLYPHIAPFEDEREYLKIYPEDFVILNSRFYKLAHNSFLLHGYYNYRHLILNRVEKRGEPCYYIGVPGNFYDREKQVAVMFGFESFECRDEPADTGEYGYYMIRVEL